MLREEVKDKVPFVVSTQQVAQHFSLLLFLLCKSNTTDLLIHLSAQETGERICVRYLETTKKKMSSSGVITAQTLILKRIDDDSTAVAAETRKQKQKLKRKRKKEKKTLKAWLEWRLPRCDCCSYSHCWHTFCIVEYISQKLIKREVSKSCYLRKHSTLNIYLLVCK